MIGQREGTYLFPRYQTTSFMIRGNCFMVTILIHSIKTACVGRKQSMVAKADY